MATTTAVPTLDLRGKMITTFIAYETASSLEQVAVGGQIDVVTDRHPAIEHEMRTWADVNGHRVVEAQESAEGRRFTIEKGVTAEADRSMAVVVSTDGLEELLSPLAFALAGALERVDVHLYFQGPGVHVLDRDFQPKLTGWWRRPFTRFAAAGMAESGHIAARDKLRQLVSLGAHIYVCAPSLDRFGVDPQRLMFDGIPQIEYLTFMEIMKGADVHLYV